MFYKNTNTKIIQFICLTLFTLILCGCSSGPDVPEIKCTCKKTTDLSEVRKPEADEPYLLTCIYNGDLKAVKETVSKNDLDEEKVPGAVILAIQCNRKEILEWLLDNGWSANPKQYDSALATAYQYNCDLVKILLKNGAELNEREMKHLVHGDYECTALNFAIRTGKLCMVKTTLECDIDADPGSSYYPPLLDAVVFARNDVFLADTMCRLLIKYGADPDTKGDVLVWGKKKEVNPAEYLILNRVEMSSSLFGLLIDYGADAEFNADDLRAIASPKDVIENKTGLFDDYPEVREDLLRKYLFLACSTPEFPDSEKYNEALLEAVDDADIDLNQPLPGTNESPLALARKNNNKKLCDLLIRYGAK